MNIPAGRHAEATLQSSGEVGDDVAEHIIGHNHVERPRISDHLHAEGVHAHVLHGDLRKFAAYFFEHALPQATGVGHGIRLIAHQDTVTRRAVELGVALAIFERVADDALHALARVDVFLNRNLIRRSLFEDAAGVG